MLLMRVREKRGLNNSTCSLCREIFPKNVINIRERIYKKKSLKKKVKKKKRVSEVTV